MINQRLIWHKNITHILHLQFNISIKICNEINKLENEIYTTCSNVKINQVYFAMNGEIKDAFTYLIARILIW